MSSKKKFFDGSYPQGWRWPSEQRIKRAEVDEEVRRSVSLPTKVILPIRYHLQTFAKNEGMKKADTPLRRKWLGADTWAPLLSAYEKSNMSVKDFCASQGVSAASYYRWQKRLQSDKGTATVFTPIEIQTKSSGGIVVELPGDVVLRFEELPPVEYLRRLSSQYSGV